MQLVSDPILKRSHIPPIDPQWSALRDLPKRLAKGPE